MTAAVSRYVRVTLDERAELTASAAHLLEVLANLANTAGVAWPSVDTLADRMRASVRTVRRARAELVDAGVIAVETGGGNRSNRYRFPIGSHLEVVHTPVTHDPGTPVISSTYPGHGRPPPRSPMTAEGSIEGSKEGPGELAEDGSPGSPVCDVCGELVDELGRWRHAACPPPTRRAQA